MAKDNRGDFYPVPVVDQGTRPGAITRLILFILVLTVTAVLFGIFRERLGDPFLLGMLGVLAMTGVGFLFAAAIGFVQIASRSTTDELSKSFIDSMAQGLVVTDSKGRIVYANRAYADMTGATSASDLRTVEALLSDVPEAADAIYRLASDLRDGQPGSGEFRLARSLRPGANGGPRWYRAQARTFKIPGERQFFSAWQLADISRERAEQERFFLDLQQAIDHLDHAPAGFFAADAESRITYVNSTLAEWLGVDLASFTPGDLTLGEIVAGDGMALIRAVKADPGTTRNAVIDLDLAMATGQALPVRLLHRVTANRDSSSGPTRTVVLNRTQGEDSSSNLRASEIRFTRFFNSTPMAIAGVDQRGRILRTNAPFFSLFATVVDRDAIDRHIRFDSVIHERDRPVFALALEKARRRQADIDPIETVLPNNEERHVRLYVNAVADSSEGDAAEEAAIVYAVDTTEQKALEGQMAQSQKMQAVGQIGGRHRARLQQRADGHHHGFRPSAHQPQAVRSVLPGHHEHQAECEPGGVACPATARLLAQADAAAGSPQPDRRAGRPAHAADAPGRQQHQAQGRSRPRSVAGESRHQPVRTGDRQSCGQCARCHAVGRIAHSAHEERQHGRGAIVLLSSRARERRLRAGRDRG